MNFMFSRPKILAALEQEFELDEFEPAYWMVTTARSRDGKSVSAVHIGAGGLGDPITIPAARGYAVRAHNRISSIVDRMVAVRVSVEPGLFCDVTVDTGYKPQIRDLLGQMAYRMQQAVVRNPENDEGAPCVSCAVRTNGVYARNIYCGLPQETRPIAETRYPTFHLCPECAEKADEECTREYRESPESIETLVRVLPKIDDEEARARIANCLVKAGVKAVPHLVRALPSDHECAGEIVTALGMIGEPAVLAIVDEAAINPAALRPALLALAVIGDDAVPTLMGVLQAETGSVRARIAGTALRHIIEQD